MTLSHRGVGSSDDFHFKKTYQYFDNTFMSTGASGVLFGGRATSGWAAATAGALWENPDHR